MNLKSISRIAVLASMTLLLTACPYKSKVPITPAEEKIDKNLLGEWMSLSELDYSYPTYYKIEKFDKFKYDVAEMIFNTTDSVYNETRYFMHASTVGGKKFMNVENTTDNDGYYLYRLDMEGEDRFTLIEVSENIDEQFTTSADLKKFVEKYMDLSFFYSLSEVKYIRKPK